MNSIKSVAVISLLITGAAYGNQAPVTDSSVNSNQQRLATLERLIESSNQRQLSVQQQLDALLDEVNLLRGETEVHSHKLEQLVERQRELYQELENRFSRLQTQQQQTSALLNPSEPAQVQDKVVYSEDVSENQAYDKAMDLVLKQRKYQQAIPEFRKFIDRFPDSEYTPNAYYWLGQLLFNKASYTQARAPFERVIHFYPDSNKRSDALFKLGSIAVKTNNSTEAKKLFNQVIAEYPESTAAHLARTRLKSLN